MSKRKAKHSKLKNTGVLFELLTRQATSDILSGVDDSTATTLLSKYFKETTELGKENKLYTLVSNTKVKSESEADRLLEVVLRSRKKINSKRLSEQKFKLVGEIRDNFNFDGFFKSNINNYKIHASLYKLFEHELSSNSFEPDEIFKAKNTIIETVVKEKSSKGKNEISDIDYLKEQSEDLRLLTQKILIDSFNKKYSSKLNEKQTLLIREYINNISNTDKLKRYLCNEISYVKSEISKIGVDSEVVKIKLNEIVSQLEMKVTKSTFVKDSFITSLMMSYQLLDELRSVK